MPLEKLSDLTSGAPGTADTLDRRLLRLEEILATAGRSSGDGTGEVVDAETAALQQLPLVAARLQELTREIEVRVGAGSWDAADRLGARLLLEDLAAALRSSRLVATKTSARLQQVSETIKRARQQLKRMDQPRDESVNGS